MVERRTPDGKTAYLEAGHGRPLILLHGFPMDKAMWTPQVDALSTAARVLVPDLPGFGGSCGFDGRPSMDGMADRVAEFLDALQIREKVIVGGLSMGGYVTLAFARRHPGRLVALILADTRAGADDEAGKTSREKMIALTREAGPRAVIEQMLPNLVGPDVRTERPGVVDEIRDIASAQEPAAVIAALEAMRDRPDSTPHLGAIAVPTLIVVGEQDAITPPSRSEEMARAIPAAELVVLPATGHASNLERPEAFNAAVLAFLYRVA